MRTLAPFLLIPVFLLVPAFQSKAGPIPTTPEPATLQAEGSHVEAQRRDLPRSYELSGVLVPADAQEIALWPQAYAGELLFLEVTPHGSFVNEGDVVARFDRRSPERQVEDARIALEGAQRGMRGTTEKGRLAAETAAAQRTSAERSLARARRALEGWREHQLDFTLRGEELAMRARDHQIADQEDELAQLELMYGDDELVDATEEIVLSRSRRDLAVTRAYRQLSLEQLEYGAEYERPLRVARLEEAVETSTRTLEHLKVTQELDAAERAAQAAAAARALLRAEEQLAQLEADLELLTLRAPRSGVLLHGSSTTWRSGTSYPVHRRGGRAATRDGLFLVADPDRLQVACQVPATDRGAVRQGAGVVVHPVGGGQALVGRLAVDSYPRPGGACAVWAEIDQPLPGLTAGTLAKVELQTEGEQGVLLLPKSAVRRSGGAAWCWLSAGGANYTRVEVSVTREHDGDLVVEGEIPDGARILLGEE